MTTRASTDTNLDSNSDWDSTLGVWKSNKIPWCSSLLMEFPKPLWIFGYASVCWNPSFPYIRKCHAHIKGYLRRFWQKSCDHRGTANNPGLVMTIISHSDLKICTNENIEIFKSDENVCGMAYLLSDEGIEEEIKKMDIREKGGYSRMICDIHLHGNDNKYEVVQGLLYLGQISNPNFCYLKMDECANIISKSVGPSGTNRQYLYSLNDWFVEHCIHEQYVKQLTQKVRNICLLHSLDSVIHFLETYENR